MQRSKNYRKVAEQVDRTSLYSPAEAVRLAKETTTVKFDPTVEVAMRLGVDPRKADQMVRGVVNLPHGTGKTVRVIAFAAGAKAQEAEAAGADAVGTDELVARIQEGWLEFDAAIATPDQMAKIGRIARILGPRGLMPNPKVGTVSADVATAVKNAKAGQVQYRTDKAGIVQCTIGRASFSPDDLKTNLTALIDALNKAKPAGVKGVYLRKVSVSSTMGAGVRVDTSGFAQSAANA